MLVASKKFLMSMIRKRTLIEKNYRIIITGKGKASQVYISFFFFPFVPQKHMLYLNIDNSLHDCSDIRSGDLNDSDIVQDYKKMSRKLSQTNMKVR